MAYTFDREMAAKELEISTRTLDRYIKAGKIRSKKIGKKIFLNAPDIEKIKISEAWTSSPEVSEITYESSGAVSETSPEATSADVTFFPEEWSTRFRRKSVVVDYRELYEDSRKAIVSKDKLIQELSYKAGKAEAELKNSISLLEYKKTTFLLESVKVKNEEDEKKHTETIAALEKEMKKEKMVSGFLLVATIILFIACAAIWFFSL